MHAHTDKDAQVLGINMYPVEVMNDVLFFQ